MPSTHTARNGDSASFTDITATGTITGAVTGAITGNVTGNTTGTHIGGQQDAVVAITGDGAITIAPSTVFLSKGSAAAITLAAPTAGTHDGIIIRVVAISAQAHVITSGTVGFNAKGSSGTATFGGARGDAVTLIAYQGNWYTTCAPDGVTFA